MNIWEEAFAKADPKKRLIFIYLANDIIQNTRKRGPEFVVEFFRVLPRCLQHVLSKADASTRAKIHKVIKVWEERSVFGSSSKEFHQLLADSSDQRHTTGGQPKPHPLVAALESAAAAAQQTASLCQLAQKNSDPMTSSRMLAAVENEIAKRNEAINLLTAELQEQEKGVAGALEQKNNCGRSEKESGTGQAEILAKDPEALQNAISLLPMVGGDVEEYDPDAPW